MSEAKYVTNDQKMALLARWEKDFAPRRATYAEFGREFGISERQVKRKLSDARRLRDQGWSSEIDPEPELDDPDGYRKIVDEGPNRKVLEYRGGDESITTVDELLQHFGIDPDQWVITKVIANTWEGYRADKSKDITITDGVMSGWSRDSGGINTVPINQVKVYLERREPVAVRPVVHPVVFHFPRMPKTEKRKRSEILTHVTLPDPQFGFRRSLRTGSLTSFHDRQALSVAAQIVEYLQPNQTTWVGDIADFPEAQSKFPKSPELVGTMQPTVYEIAWWLARIGRATEKQAGLEGNHEKRLKHVLYASMTFAYDLRAVTIDGVADHPALSLPGLTGMAEIGMQWWDGYPDNFLPLRDDLVVIHGSDSAGPGGTAGKHVSRKGYDSIFGHVHRAEFATRRIPYSFGESRVVTSISPGCLCKVDGSVPGSTSESNWNQGILVTEYHPTDLSVPIQHTHVPIVDGKALFRGILFEAEEDIDERVEAAALNVGFFARTE